MPTYYTQIEEGAPANANTFNEPMDQLDAAIVARAAAVAAEAVARGAADDALDNRIDDIVATTGDDIVEVVDARGAGNVADAATSLAERIEWLEGAQNVYAAAYGFDDGGTAAANLIALDAATAAAVAFAAPAVVWLPAGRFAVNNFTVPVDIVIRGARMPYHDKDGSDDLEGGTVITGAAVTLSAGSGLMDLGLQVSSGKSTISGAGSDRCLILNVATKGNGSDHGCVFTSGDYNYIQNFYAAEFDHGLVFKGSYNYASGIRTWNCLISCLTLKSDAAVDCIGNIINGLISDGEIDTAPNPDLYPGGIWLHAEDAATSHSVERNIISNFYIHNPGFGCYITGAENDSRYVRYNRLSNGIIENSQYGGIQFGAGTGTTDNEGDYNDFDGITIINSGTYSFVNLYGGDHNSIHSCRSVNPTVCHTSGTWAKAEVGIASAESLIVKAQRATDQTLSTGTTLQIIEWDAAGIDPNNMYDHAGADPEEITNFPFHQSYYRIRAVITFDANATGSRAIAINRYVSGWGGYVAYNIAPTASANMQIQVVAEAIEQMNTAWRIRVEAWQNSGGNLDIDKDKSYVTVELVR